MERTYLKKAREELGLTQSDVAKRVGISANYYCDIENGNIILPEKTINGEWKHCVFCGRNGTLGNCY